MFLLTLCTYLSVEKRLLAGEEVGRHRRGGPRDGCLRRGTGRALLAVLGRDHGVVLRQRQVGELTEPGDRVPKPASNQEVAFDRIPAHAGAGLPEPEALGAD